LIEINEGDSKARRSTKGDGLKLASVNDSANVLRTDTEIVRSLENGEPFGIEWRLFSYRL